MLKVWKIIKEKYFVTLSKITSLALSTKPALSLTAATGQVWLLQFQFQFIRIKLN